MSADLRVSIGSLTLNNPVLVASGTFGYGEEFAPYFDLSVLGGVVTKTITLEPRAGNPPPRIAETAAGMLNSIGLANVGVEVFVREKLPALQRYSTAIIVNIAGRSADEFKAVLRRLEECDLRIDGYELNYSCPNVKEGGMAFSARPDVAYEVTVALRKETTRPLIAKLTPNVTRIGEIARAVAEAGADAVSAINTLVGMAVDHRTRTPKLATVVGGLSGPAIKPVALAKVWEIKNAVSIPIIGVGGIQNYEDVLEFMLVGASAVQVGTANFVTPDCAARIVRDLESYCDREGIDRLADLVGRLNVEC
ncbi:MAG: dihydroorotate dehydrogenase [candidate division KSB1 bacterium]|nr:dihydroorotate dehydrogenase [candidate division KSB1 bacterium]MDZ7386359.1 dihydroorotate dehydrogenase [candidate division KSB1 bacterium]MDZ7394000.1 dihydroorotate dehydrogenase [candidate division KSB1 bacterium]